MKDNATLKEKIANNGYFRYFRAVVACPHEKQRNFGEVLAAICSVWFLCIILNLMCAFTDDDSAGVSMSLILVIGIIGYLAPIIMGTFRRIKPSLLAVAPINYKKRVAFAYITDVLSIIVICAVIAVSVLLGTLFISVLGYVFTGEWMFVLDTSETITLELGVQARLFEVFLALLMYGVGSCVSNIQSKKSRLIVLLAFPAALELLALIMLNVANRRAGFIFSGHLSANFENLPLSALWLSLFGILSVGSVICSVFLAVKAQKPKNY